MPGKRTEAGGRWSEQLKELIKGGDQLEELITESGGALLLKVGSVALSLGIQLALARTLGPGGYGEYSYIIAWANLLVLVATVGLDEASLRFVAEYWQHRETGLLLGFRTRTIQLVAIAGVVVGATWIVVVAATGLGGETASLHSYLFGALLIIPLAAVRLRSATARALGLPLKGLVPQVIMVRALLLCAVLVLWVTAAEKTSAEVVLLAHAAAAGSAFLYSQFLVNSRISDVADEEEQYATKEWLRVASPLLVVGGTNYTIKRADIIILGLFVDRDKVGVYSLATKLAGLSLFGLQAVNAIVAPRIRRLQVSGDQERFQQYIARASGIIFALTVILALGLAGLGRPVIKLFGSEFLGAYPLLLILLLGQCANAMAGAVGYLMNLTGNEMLSAKVFAVTAVLSVSLLILAIPRYGLVGAAAVTAGTTAVWNVWLALLVKQRVGVDPTVIAAMREIT